MTPEEVFKTALEYENNVTELYIEAVAGTNDVAAKKFFQTMADEEKLHVDFLEAKLAEWMNDEQLEDTELTTVVPDPEIIKKGVEALKKKMSTDRTLAYGPEVAMLKKALKAEEETSNFYRNLVGTLPQELDGIFRRFLEIEDGHRALVEAELDAVEGNSFWFDCQEFGLE